MPTSVLIGSPVLWPMWERSPASRSDSAPGPRSPTCCRSAAAHEQRLSGAAQAPGLVPQHALRESDAVRADVRDRVEMHPLPRRLAHEVDRQLGVDEEMAPVVERGADAVAGVGG